MLSHQAVAYALAFRQRKVMMSITILFFKEKTMKYSSGTSIKILSTAMFVLGSIGSVYLAYQVAEIYFSRLIDDPAKGVVVFALVSILGVFVSWISTICLRGFGELVENTSKMEEKISSMQRDLEYMKSSVADVHSINEILKASARHQKKTPDTNHTTETSSAHSAKESVEVKEQNRSDAAFYEWMHLTGGKK
jgi:regulator of replication initiation timing